MICQTCQRDNPPDGVFCGGCGTRLTLVCAGCGQSSPPGNTFCGKCGGRLVPEVEEAAAEPERGERRQLTVLFCDLVGSTDLAARLDPEEYREALREYFTRADEVIGHYGGFVAQHLGDGLLVYFGWPQTYDDAAERAVHAGLGLIASTGEVRAGGGDAAGALASEICRVLGSLRAGKISRDELERAKRRHRMHLDFLQDSPSDLVGWFGGTELFRQPDQDPLGPPHIAEPVRVLVPHHVAHELPAALAEPGERIVDVLHGEHDA